MGDASSLGFGHFIAQSDIVAKVLLAVLVIMSAISWYLIVYKGISQVVRQKRSQRFLTFFWSATSLEQVLDEQTTSLENGLTMRATIGATAPFVGLFGTVWGVYHALVAIGMSGSG